MSQSHRVLPAATDDAAELARHAFNAAFHELGLRWYWDLDTYEALCGRAADAGERVRAYLGSHQAHLLSAYDADFLVEAIVSRMQRLHRELGARAPRALACDWVACSRGELGF